MSPEHWSTPVAIAHRGSRFLWPENTMEAFSSAVALGFTHIETDLRITGDGVVVCFHDSTVDRTTDGTGLLAAMTLKQVAGLDAGFRHRGEDGFSHRGRGVGVPSLEELVTSFPEVRLVVDIKCDGMTGELTRIFDTYSLYERVIVGSYRDDRLAELRQATANRVATSTGSVATRRWLLASRLGRGVAGEAKALQVPRQIRGVRMVDQRLVRVAHDSGLHVHVWTVNEPGEMRHLLDLGVDGLVTDRPDLLRDVLSERGEWPA